MYLHHSIYFKKLQLFYIVVVSFCFIFYLLVLHLPNLQNSLTDRVDFSLYLFCFYIYFKNKSISNGFFLFVCFVSSCRPTVVQLSAPLCVHASCLTWRLVLKTSALPITGAPSSHSSVLLLTERSRTHTLPLPQRAKCFRVRGY